MKLNNKYYILRHGEALSNVRHIVSSWPEKFENPLTQRGVEMIKEAAEKLKYKNIDLIFASDLLRTKQTAEIVAKVLNPELELEFDKSSTTFKKLKVVLDERLREISFGIMNGGPIADLDVVFKKEEERIKNKMSDGESYEDVLKRVYDFLMDIDKKYKGNPPSRKASEGRRNILIISHECPLWILESKVRGMSLLQYLKEVPRDDRIHKGQIKELN